MKEKIYKITLLPALLLVLVIIMSFTVSSYERSNTTVRIGNQEWMKTNLATTTFKTGDPIPQAKNMKEWNEADDNEEPAWCYYRFDKDMGEKFGLLYNGYAVKDPRGLAPEGWHIPSTEEFNELILYLGGTKKAVQKLKSREGWKVRNGTDASNFSAVMSGSITYDIRDLIFTYDGLTLWTSDIESQYSEFLSENITSAQTINITDYFDKIYLSQDVLSEGFSVRCLKD